MYLHHIAERITRWIVLILTVSACTACSSPDQPAASGLVEATPELTFQPAQATVRVNGTITWRFSSVPHNVAFVAAAGRPADIPGLNADTSAARTFPSAGTFVYECTLHAGMRGTVVVTAAPPAGYPTAMAR